MRRQLILSVLLAAAMGLISQVNAATVGWTDWTSATPSNGTVPGSATGTMTFGSNTVNVSYSGELDSNTQTGGSGTDYITPLGTYTGSTVSNAPPGGNLITVTGGTSFTDTVTFSSPVQDFLMAFVSLGAPSVTVTYQFNTEAPISVLSTGTGWWGGDTNLTFGHNASGLDTITGTESDGVIQFGGDFTSISWTIPPPGEYWDGWTFGAVAQAAPVSPPTGVPLPSSALLSLSGLIGLGILAYAKKLKRRMA